MLAAGRAMRDAIAADLAALGNVHVTLAVAPQEASPARWQPRVRAIAPAPGEDAVAFVRRQAPLHDACWIVAPETGGLLHAMWQAVGEPRWIGCSGAAIALATSKRATCAALGHAGIVTPIALSNDPAAAWVVKPDDGAGTLQTRRFPARSAAEAELRRSPGAVAQPFVPGEPLSISVIVGPDLADVVAFNRQQVEVDAEGWLHDRGVLSAALHAGDARVPALRALAREVVAAIPGLRGYIGIDVVWNERRGPVVIEINPRVTCAYVGLSTLLQRNLAAQILAAHALAEPGLA